jgi:hypothetical protein
MRTVPTTCSGKTAHCNQLLGPFVDLVAVVPDKNALLNAKHRASQFVGFLSFPWQRGPFDTVLGGRVQRRHCRRDIK